MKSHLFKIFCMKGRRVLPKHKSIRKSRLMNSKRCQRNSLRIILNLAFQISKQMPPCPLQAYIRIKYSTSLSLILLARRFPMSILKKHVLSITILLHNLRDHQFKLTRIFPAYLLESQKMSSFALRRRFKVLRTCRTRLEEKIVLIQRYLCQSKILRSLE